MWISVQLRAALRWIASWYQSEPWRCVCALREGRAVEIAAQVSRVYEYFRIFMRQAKGISVGVCISALETWDYL